jgi:hypothetical protein
VTRRRAGRLPLARSGARSGSAASSWWRRPGGGGGGQEHAVLPVRHQMLVLCAVCSRRAGQRPACQPHLTEAWQRPAAKLLAGVAFGPDPAGGSRLLQRLVPAETTAWLEAAGTGMAYRSCCQRSKLYWRGKGGTL